MPEHNTTEELNLRLEEVQEILTNPSAWIVRWGITMIFMFTIIILVLSFIIRYPDFVTAKVIVTTKKPTERIVARYSGALEDIYIKNGDTVDAGQRLAVFRNTTHIEDVYTLKAILDTVRPRSNGLLFPIEATSNLVLGDVETAYINFEKSYVDYQLLKDLDPYTNQLSGNRKSLAEIKLRLQDQIKQKKVLEQEYKLKKREFDRYKRLYEKRTISQQELESKNLEFLQIEKNISAMAISISQMREAISNAGQTLKKSIRDWEYTYVLSSAIAGVASFQEFWGTNQFVSSGEVVFSILPIERSSLVGQLTIPSQNAGKVTLGQKVLIKLDNFPYQQYGTLVGEVRHISISPNKEGNYFVYIALPNGTLTSYNRELPFDQELIGNAEIITEDLSVAERIFYKFKDLFKYRYAKIES